MPAFLGPKRRQAVASPELRDRVAVASDETPVFARRLGDIGEDIVCRVALQRPQKGVQFRAKGNRLHLAALAGDPDQLLALGDVLLLEVHHLHVAEAGL